MERKTRGRAIAAPLIGSLLLLGLGGGALAAEGGAEAVTGRTQAAADEAAGKMLRSGSLIGATVENDQEQALGKVDQLAINPNTGEIDFVVIAYDRGFDMGDKLTAVPWDALSIGADGQLSLPVEKERFAEAPTFPRGQWPELTSDSTFGTRAYSYFHAPLSQKWASDPEGLQQSPVQSGAASFGELDADADGVLSREEAAESRALSANFDQVDVNGDGRIDAAELAAFEAVPIEEGGAEKEE